MKQPNERLIKARVQLLLKEPFFGSLVLKLNLVETESIDTMATDGSVIKYNNAFIESLTDEEIKGVLCHEVLHCALGHVFRLGERNPHKFNKACDYAINPLLAWEYGYTLPKGGLLDKKYLGMGAEEIYAKLPDDPEEDEKEMWGGMLPPPEGKGSSTAEKAAEWKLATKLAAEEAKGIGKLSGALKELLKQAEPKICWKTQLAQLIGGISKSDFSWTNPNTSYIHQNLYLPSLHEPTIGNLVFAIDTSGSVRSAELAQFLGELTSVLDTIKFESLTVIQCDTAIVDEQEYEMGDSISLEVQGRGGTKVSPVFDWIQENMERPSALIYFTDMGINDFPLTTPEYPVFWARTSSCCDAPFGVHINLFDGEDL